MTVLVQLFFLQPTVFFLFTVFDITTACFDWSTYARVVFAWDENTLQMSGRPSVFISMKSLCTMLPKSNNDVVGLHFFIFLFLYDLMIQANFIVYNVIKWFLCVLKRETGTMVIGSGKLKRPAFRVIMYDASDV